MRMSPVHTFGLVLIRVVVVEELDLEDMRLRLQLGVAIH